MIYKCKAKAKCTKKPRQFKNWNARWKDAIIWQKLVFDQVIVRDGMHRLNDGPLGKKKIIDWCWGLVNDKQWKKLILINQRCYNNNYTVCKKKD